ncbi:nuclear transport factor 2 family protein [Actinomadura sp. GC306]|uniref:nuclear transport factor 2 family protein n=1 Tax=Actinomadura sp. GC306 TaxID=2530367 RepID=UPI001051AF8D|nr:nuclear transport factor 2 family protein [Actinomadura sp. GC306]TDC69192.1 nuclear transport factor 2 family protein [Actinomadura sp. GC306]
MTTTDTTPELIQRYFELASGRDDEAYVALFAADALVEDEGKEYAGIDAIRAWRSGVPRVEHTITSVEPTGEGMTVTCTIAGDFPGSPVAGLRFHFEKFDDDHIQVLRIRI